MLCLTFKMEMCRAELADQCIAGTVVCFGGQCNGARLAARAAGGQCDAAQRTLPHGSRQQRRPRLGHPARHQHPGVLPNSLMA